MSRWFFRETTGLSFKSIPFVTLRDFAYNKWGYKAPEQEHLENKIKSRDKAVKEGRVCRWVQQQQAIQLGSVAL